MLTQAPYKTSSRTSQQRSQVPQDKKYYTNFVMRASRLVKEGRREDGVTVDLSRRQACLPAQNEYDVGVVRDSALLLPPARRVGGMPIGQSPTTAIEYSRGDGAR